MRQTVYLGLVLFLCVALFACSLQPTEVSSSPEPSAAPSVPPSPGASLDPALPSALSYDEFFSEIREHEDGPAMGNLSEPFREGSNGSIVRKSDGKTICDGATRPQLIYGEDGTYSEVMFIKDNCIYVTENMGEDIVPVYTAENGIEPVYCPSDALFAFIDGTKRCRLHIPSRTVDFMFDLPGVLTEEETVAIGEEDRQGQLYVWMEELTNNHVWNVQIDKLNDDEWLANVAAAQGLSVDEMNAQNRATRMTLIYDAYHNVWAGEDFVFDALALPDEIPEDMRLSPEEYEQLNENN